MGEEPQEILEEKLGQAEARWYKLLEERKNRYLEKPDVIKQEIETFHTREEDWRELKKKLREAEERWRKQLLETKDPHSLIKPEILQLGPRPREIKRRPKKDEEAKFEIFPLPKQRGLRGGFVNVRKNDLSILNNDLRYEKDEHKIQAINRRIACIKKEITTHRKQVRKNKKRTAIVEQLYKGVRT